jgi:hypothetical protein
MSRCQHQGFWNLKVVWLSLGNQDLKFYLPTKNTGCPSPTDLWWTAATKSVVGTCPQLWGICPGRPDNQFQKPSTQFVWVCRQLWNTHKICTSSSWVKCDWFNFWILHVICWLLPQPLKYLRGCVRILIFSGKGRVFLKQNSGLKSPRKRK